MPEPPTGAFSCTGTPGPLEPGAGTVIFPGPAVGSDAELWDFANCGEFRNAGDFFRDAAFGHPHWSASSFDWSHDVAMADRATGDRFHVRPGDLQEFLRRGGRLLLDIGWNDYHNSAELAQWYRQSAHHGGARGAHQLRFSALPGIGHCQGGPGCDTFSKLAVIDRWVSSRVAPEQIVVAKLDKGGVIRERRACAWPKVARYDGMGAKDKAYSFSCASR